MNDLATRQPSQFSASPERSALTAELAKMLSLVAPVTMTADQQTLWLASAVDALQDIRASEVSTISMEVRRSATRHSQIVPEIAKLVAANRSERRRFESVVALPGPAPKRPVMDRRGEPMSEEDTAELNRILENLKAKARYRPDGSKYFVEAA